MNNASKVKKIDQETNAVQTKKIKIITNDQMMTALDLAVQMGLIVIEPSLYQIVIWNDDFTPMEFVVHTLEKYFYMNRRKAVDTMFLAHTTGKAVCGVYNKDIAETKLEELSEYIRIHEYPLTYCMEAV